MLNIPFLDQTLENFFFAFFGIMGDHCGLDNAQDIGVKHYFLLQSQVCCIYRKFTM